MAIKQLLDYCDVILKLNLVISNKKYILNQIKTVNIEREKSNLQCHFFQFSQYFLEGCDVCWGKYQNLHLTHQSYNLASLYWIVHEAAPPCHSHSAMIEFSHKQA